MILLQIKERAKIFGQYDLHAFMDEILINYEASVLQ
jgi:hypothetical protein